MDILSKQIVSSLIWRYSERFGNQLIQLGVSIVLARILLPSDFGTIALNTFFLVIASLLTDSGFISAIIQKKSVDSLDLSTVFYANLSIALTIYLILFCCAPFVAEFYNTPIVTNLLRIQALTLFFSAFNGVQQALLSRRMLFKKSFRITFLATVTNGAIGISMALSGCGLWSLIFAQLSASIVTTIMIWFTIGWRPTWQFSYTRLRSMMGFGSRFMFVGLSTAIFNNILSVIIGKRYSISELGYYNRGQTLSALVVDNLANSLGQVLLPALSSCQEDKDMIIAKFKQAIVYSSYGVFFLLAMMIAMAEPIVTFLYGERWLPAAPFLQLACIGYFLYAVNQINQIAICSMGRSDLHLKYDLIKKGVMTIFLIATIPFGIYWMVLGYSISMLISAFISTIPTGRIIGYGLFLQLRAVGLSLVAAIVAGLCAWSCNSLIDSRFFTLVLQLSVGVLIYIVLSVILKLEGLQPILKVISYIRLKSCTIQK